MNLYTKQKQTHRHRKQIYGYQRGEGRREGQIRSMGITNTSNYTWNWRRQWHPTPVLLPGKCHGWRSLVGCSPWDRWESDTTERLHFHFSLSCIGEGNGNPLQCFCLENPSDGGAWLASVYGVAQNWTRLKWPSSSSSTHEIDKQQRFVVQHGELYSVSCNTL